MNEDRIGQFIHGYWFVAYLDLLGIRRALLKTDFHPSDDSRQNEELLAALKESVGAIRWMRRWLQRYFDGLEDADHQGSRLAGLPPEKIAEFIRLRKTRVRRDLVSDGIFLACPLLPEDDHFPIRAVHDAIGACATLMLVQLAARRPIRGGLDVATGIEIDDELFGAACVRAYEIESNRCKYPRLVAGEGLVNYLHLSLQAPGNSLERRFERTTAENMLALLKEDFDGEWIVDYAGAQAHGLFITRGTAGDLLERARAFAHQARADFRQGNDELARKLFGRYSQLVRYLDACGP